MSWALVARGRAARRVPEHRVEAERMDELLLLRGFGGGAALAVAPDGLALLGRALLDLQGLRLVLVEVFEREVCGLEEVRAFIQDLEHLGVGVLRHPANAVDGLV